MVFIIVLAITLFGIILGKVLFHKWFNHLTLYCIIWSILVLLYEWKLLPYVNLIPLAWFYIFSAFFSFLLGILTITSAKKIFIKDQIENKSEFRISIFLDDGKIVKYSILFFSTICLFAALQHWMILLKMFGSIPAIFLNASRVYRLNNEGEIKGIIPYISTFGYVAIFFAGIYTAYKGRFSLLTFFPFLGVIIKDLASIGRAGMLLGLMEFIFSFLLFRHLLKEKAPKKFKFSRANALFAFVLLVLLFVTIASFVRISRGSSENFNGTSRELRQLQDNMILSPSLYLYLSSDIGVLNQYLRSDGENTKFGQNTFLTFYGLFAKFGIVEKPKDFQKGYFIPMWTNTGTYIRELHADFGICGVFLFPFLLGLLTTWMWFRFYERKNLIVFAFLVYLYLIIGFSFMVMVTRLPSWTISLFIIVIYLPILEKWVKYGYKGPKE